jgi:hypothetical protein
MSLPRQTVHEEEASLTRMDLAEARVGLHERAQHMNRCEQSDTMTAAISLKHPPRQAGGMRGLSCSVLTSSPQKTPDCLARHAMQWQPGKRIRGAHGHGASRSAILPLGCHGEAHLDLDAAVPIRSGKTTHSTCSKARSR